MGRKTDVFFLLCLFSMCRAMQKPDAVIFDAEAIVKQDIGAKTKELARLLYGSYVWGISEIKLECDLWNAFGVPLFQERSARIKFFDFLRGVVLPEHLHSARDLPVTSFEGDRMPPIMSAWVLDKLPVIKLVETVTAHINALDVLPDVKKFYHALVRTTFDTEIMGRTCRLHKKTLEVLDQCRLHSIPTYAVGHCAPELCGLLQQKAPGLLEKFNKVLFSYQCADMVTSETKFDEEFWCKQLEQSYAETLHSCVYVDNIESDNPPHYKTNSSALMSLVS